MRRLDEIAQPSRLPGDILILTIFQAIIPRCRMFQRPLETAAAISAREAAGSGTVANEDTALREVDQELAEERQWAMFRQYGPAVIGGALAIVLGVAGWQFWNLRADNAAKDMALEFQNAIELLASDPAQGRDALRAISEESTGGYGVLAAFHRAASFSRGGERLSAVETYREIYNNGAAPKEVRDLARLRAGYLSLSDGRDSVLEDLGDLPSGGSAYAFHAQEISGLAALEEQDYETALSIFRQLSIDLGAPAAIRDRAEDFAALAASGKAGVNITGEARIDDLLSAINEGAAGAAPVDDHAGHDHGDEEAIDAAAESAPDGSGETEDAAPSEDEVATPETSENE